MPTATIVILVAAGLMVVLVSPLVSFARRDYCRVIFRPRARVHDFTRLDKATKWRRRKGVAVRYIRQARKTLRIRLEEMCQELYDSPHMQRALRRALRRGVAICILGGPSVVAQDSRGYKVVQLLRERFGQDNLQIRFTHVHPPRHHYTIVDERLLVVEEPHPPREPTSKLYVVEASQEHIREYDKEWGAAHHGSEPRVQYDDDRDEVVLTASGPA